MGSATASAKVVPRARGPGVAEPTQNPTRTVSAFSTVESLEVMVTVARFTLSAARPEGLAVRTRSPPAVPLPVTLSQVWSELADQGVAAPRLSVTRTVFVSVERAGMLASATPLSATRSLWASRLKVTGSEVETKSPFTVAEKAREPLRVPPWSPVRSGVTFTVTGVDDAVLAVEDAVIQVLLGVAVHGYALAPVFRPSWTDFELRSRPLAPPRTSPVGESENAALVSVRFTLTVAVRGDPPADAVKVTVEAYGPLASAGPIDGSTLTDRVSGVVPLVLLSTTQPAPAVALQLTASALFMETSSD